jgi:lysophospholipase L1-like esterase
MSLFPKIPRGLTLFTVVAGFTTAMNAMALGSLFSGSDDGSSQTPYDALREGKSITLLSEGKKRGDKNQYLLDKTFVESGNAAGFDLNTEANEQGEPFYVSVKVPEGNYLVTVTFGHKKYATENTVKAESRRLYIENLKTNPGEFVTERFTVNVRTANLRAPEKNAPGGTRVAVKTREQHALHWDDKLTLEFNGKAPFIQSIELQKMDVPTVYLVGDSTVTDQTHEPAASWGQMLPRFFNHQIAISNHAESGETLKSFITGLRFAKVLETLKVGDYLFIQFGHNDQKKQWPQTYVAADSTYQQYLHVFIAEAKLRGAIPVLITSMQRRTFDAAGKITNSHADYPEAVRHVARQHNLHLIDLDKMSTNLYEALGVEKAPLAFNDNGKDMTHHNNYGAYQLAKCVVESIKQSPLPLKNFIHEEFTEFNPSHPDPVETFLLAPSPAFSSIRPDGN